MINTKNYAYPLILGLYPYLLFQLIALLGSGKIILFSSYLDLFLVVVGILSVVALFYFLNKFPKSQRTTLISFFAAVPFSLFLMLLGGLLCWLGILIYGLFPFVVALFISYLISRKSK